jgi:hypothetical protein
MKGFLTPAQAPLVLSRNWESLLGKLSIPVTEELLWAGGLCARYVCSLDLHVHRNAANADPQ